VDGACLTVVACDATTFEADVSQETLACTAGLPAGAQCIFNPSTPVTPGELAVDVVMNISTRAQRNTRTQSAVAAMLPPLPLGLALLGMIGSIGGCGKRFKRTRFLISSVAISFGMMLLASCAGVSNGGGDGGQPPPPVTYHITVTGTSPGTPTNAGQSTTVALVVN